MTGETTSADVMNVVDQVCGAIFFLGFGIGIPATALFMIAVAIGAARDRRAMQ